MRRLVFLLMLAALLAGVAPAPAQNQSRDEQAIRALIDRAFQADSSVDEKVAKQILGDHSSSAGPCGPNAVRPYTTLRLKRAQSQLPVEKRWPADSERT